MKVALEKSSTLLKTNLLEGVFSEHLTVMSVANYSGDNDHLHGWNFSTWVTDFLLK